MARSMLLNVKYPASVSSTSSSPSLSAIPKSVLVFRSSSCIEFLARSLRFAKKTRDLAICSTASSSFGQDLSGDDRYVSTIQGFAPNKKLISWGVLGLEGKKVFTNPAPAGRVSGALISVAKIIDGSIAGESERRHLSTDFNKLSSPACRD